MRIELNSNQDNEDKVVKSDTSSVRDEIKEQTKKLSEMTTKEKLTYIWDYYKVWIMIAIVVLILTPIMVKDIKEANKPVYISVMMINSYLGVDDTDTLMEDYINQFGVDTNEYKVYIEDGINLTEEGFDTTMLANQQKIVAMYSAKDLDVVIGNVEAIEGAANCDAYADFSQILPQELIDELIDREYEFYYFDPSKDQIEDAEGDDRGPYFAGIYLDNCSYLNNIGMNGAYPVATQEEARPVLTIPANTTRLDKSLDFIRFLIENR